MNRDFILSVANDINFKQPELIEKDFIIHTILNKLANDHFFTENFLFKGGTCLVKCYFDYYRFSEDLDFTWENQSIFQNSSSKKRKEIVAELRSQILELVDRISHDEGYIFKPEPQNKDFVEFGGNEMRLTLKIHYDSLILKIRSFIKIQLNFREEICFPAVTINKLRTLVPLIGEETKLLFKNEVTFFNSPISLRAYDLREITSEKLRAIMTRQGIKARDYVDLYMIENKYKISPKSLIDIIVRKTTFATRGNMRYRESIVNKGEELKRGPLFKWRDEEKFLIKEIDSYKFESYTIEIDEMIKEIIENNSF